MIVADIGEAKARLGSYLAAVQAGDEVVITDRGGGSHASSKSQGDRLPLRKGWPV